MSLCMCDSGSICHICMGAHRGQKKVLDTPRTVVTEGWGASDVGAWNQTWIFLKSGKCSLTLNHLSSLIINKYFLKDL